MYHVSSRPVERFTFQLQACIVSWVNKVEAWRQRLVEFLKTVRATNAGIPNGARTRIAKLLQEFLTEVSVLLFVFPVLDQFIQHGLRGITRKYVLGSFILALLVLSFASVLAAYTREDK